MLAVVENPNKEFTRTKNDLKITLNHRYAKDSSRPSFISRIVSKGREVLEEISN